MAHIDDSDTDERAVAADVNLVPFIDLMSVCIIFLLITAVWSQVSMIQIGSSIYGQKSGEEPVKPPPHAEIPLLVNVKNKGYRVVIGSKSEEILKVNGKYDYNTLVSKLKTIKKLYPEKIDAVIAMSDDLEYGFLIKGMDALLTSGFSELSVATGEVK